KFVIVSGTSEKKSDVHVTDNIRKISYCTANELFELILRSDIIISRGGYSTLMDLAHLHKKCVFVPTPGQTEQEYLVHELAKQNLVYTMDQKHFDLNTAFIAVEKTKGFFIETDPKEFLKTLEETLGEITD
ncbi:MAG: hypothetical protein H7X71_07450, partial [Chitinophagales bacterium]|nr:hypothetical protein [Chitinophagales bacterium]